MIRAVGSGVQQSDDSMMGRDGWCCNLQCCDNIYLHGRCRNLVGLTGMCLVCKQSRSVFVSLASCSVEIDRWSLSLSAVHVFVLN